MSLSPIESVSGYLNEKLDQATAISDKESKLNGLTITGRVVGKAALLVASAIETAVRYLIAFAGFAISLALKDETKENFVRDYVTPAFDHAAKNKTALFAIKDDLSLSYETHIKPFLQNKVEAPQSDTN